MMKYFGWVILGIILLISFQFIFYRSVPILGMFPEIRSKIVLKQNGEIVLVINQKGTYLINYVSLYYNGKMIYTETDKETEQGVVKRSPTVNMPYYDRVVYITLPKNVFDKITLIDGMVFNLECYGSFDQFVSASGSGFNVESKVTLEK